MSGIKDKIKAASRPERTVPVCLNGQMVGEFETAERQLQDSLRRPATDSLDGAGGTRELAERIEALRQQMLDGAVDFRLRAMGRTRWRKFIGEHPPRQDEDGALDPRDRNIGVNVDAFYPELVRRSVVEPELDDDDWAALLGDEDTDGVLTSRQFDELASAAWDLNRDTVDVPFSRAASRILSSAPE